MTSYAVVEAALARMHGADPEVQRGAFRGRIKHLQRLGLPLGAKPGKGKRIDYTEEQIWQLALALELAEFGIDPTTIVEIISSHWEKALHKFVDFGSNNSSMMLSLSVRLMSSAWRPGGKITNGVHSIRWISASSKLESLASGNVPRAIVINVYVLLQNVKRFLAESEGESLNGNNTEKSTS